MGIRLRTHGREILPQRFRSRSRTDPLCYRAVSPKRLTLPEPSAAEGRKQSAHLAADLSCTLLPALCVSIACGLLPETRRNQPENRLGEGPDLLRPEMAFCLHYPAFPGSSPSVGVAITVCVNHAGSLPSRAYISSSSCGIRSKSSLRSMCSLRSTHRP